MGKIRAPGGGRKSLYYPGICEEMVAFFDREPYETVTITSHSRNGTETTKEERVANDLPTIAAFSAKVKLNRDTLLKWSKIHPEFGEAYAKAVALQEKILITNGLHGLYATSFAIFTAKNILGWRDNNGLIPDVLPKGVKLVISND